MVLVRLTISNAIAAVYALALTACAVTGSSPDDPATEASISHLDSATTLAPTSGYGDPGTMATVDASGNENWVGGAWYVPLPVSAGDVIGTIRAVVRDNGSSNGHPLDGNNVIAVLQSRISGATSPIASASSNGTGTLQTLTITTSHIVATGEQLVVEYFGLKGGAVPSQSTVPSMTGPLTAIPNATGSLTGPVTVEVPIDQDMIFAIGDGSSVTSSVVSRPFNTATRNGFAKPLSGIPAGVTVTAVRAKLSDMPGANITVGIMAKEMPTNAVPTWVGHGTSTSNGSGTIQTISVPAINYIVPTDTTLAITFTPNGVAVQPLVIYSVSVDYQ